MLIHRSRSPLKGMLVASLLAVVSLAVAASAQATTLPTLTIAVTKTTITVGGSTQSGAVNVISTATGLKEGTAILFLLKPGITESEFENGLKESKKDPNRTEKYGSIVFDAELSGKHANETQTYLQPGRYLAIAGGEEGQKLHTLFTVTASASPVALPTPEATIRSIEFGFRGPKVLHDGELVRFENEGFLVHMDIAIPVSSKRHAEDAVRYLLEGKEKALEKVITGEPVGFAGPLSHEAFEQETITAKPGWYVQLCFMETQDGRDHTLLGMERIIKIVK
jgi:uncharacterized cupredoxin-like copper-binding protein